MKVLFSIFFHTTIDSELGNRRPYTFRPTRADTYVFKCNIQFSFIEIVRIQKTCNFEKAFAVYACLRLSNRGGAENGLDKQLQ